MAGFDAQAWYYPTDKTIVLWECFFEERFRKDPLPEDLNMQKLWQSFERYLLQIFSAGLDTGNPFNDLIAESY